MLRGTYISMTQCTGRGVDEGNTAASLRCTPTYTLLAPLLLVTFVVVIVVTIDSRKCGGQLCLATSCLPALTTTTALCTLCAAAHAAVTIIVAVVFAVG